MLWRQMPSGFDPIELPSLRHLTIISPDPSSFAQWSSSYSLRTLELMNADGTLKLFSSLLPTQGPYGAVPVRPFPALRRLDIRWNGVESRASADPAKLPDAIGRVLSDRPALTIGYGDPLPVADRLKWPRFDNDDLASRWVQLSEPADKAEWAWIYGYDP
ncbi:hypothetical protein DL93DRAFT_2081647 [Clavulina sp. PMI_390]|nr:hypothetical protein DL93DRAFT_2081647 [Clavulina sp. PMI_390]